MTETLIYRLALVTYIYCVAVLSFFCTLLFQSGADFKADELWIPILFLSHPITQFIYVARTRPMLRLRPWKDTHSLDDFMTNDTNLEHTLVEPNGLMKVFAILGVIGMGFMVFIAANRIHRLFSDMLNGADDFVINFSALICIPAGLCGILYNIRTFAMKRIAEE